MSELISLPIAKISINGGTQARTEINQATVSEYAEALSNGATFPPIVVFEDGVSIWMADGFHRFHAHKAAGLTEIDCDVRTGTQREAVLFSLSANANHGLRRTNEDKRKAVMTLLNDSEWAAWSNVSISKVCGVSDTFVGDIRKSIIGLTEDAPITRTVERNGKTYEQNTANIGKNTATPKPENQAQPVVSPEPYVMPDEEPDFVQIASDLEMELIQAQDKLQRFKNTDVEKVVADFDGLHNRLLSETAEKNDWIKKYNFQSDLLKKIRLAVGASSNSEILAKLGKS